MSFKSETWDRFEALEIKLDELDRIPSETLLKLESMQSHIISLRGLVNRKLSKSLEEEEVAQEEEEKIVPAKFNDGMDNFRGLGE